MRQPDITYSDIPPQNLNDYINLPDEEYHKLKAVTGPEGELRYDVLIWLNYEEEN